MQPSDREFDNLRRLLALAVAEDLGPGDVTSGMLGEDLQAEGRFVAREEMVFCGGAFLDRIARAYDERIRTVVRAGEGERAQAGAVLGKWSGPARGILSAERVALNFLQRLSGIATAARAYVAAVAGTGASIYDTRKTIPGWRDLAKYAVRAGGGRNHRRGLYDAVLVKDNHLAALAARGCDDPLEELKTHLGDARARLGPAGFVALEVDTLEQLERALKLPVDVILLDNMTPREMRRAVRMRDEAGLRGCVALEASGGITLEAVRAVAETGVERIAVGAVTHSARAVDIALDIEIE